MIFWKWDSATKPCSKVYCFKSGLMEGSYKSVQRFLLLKPKVF